ncbi:phospholipid/glycerol acyltransferase [Leptothrix cholodnii SP-6]|uniref:Phospholipid/glycerol acyltransferase n=1 Tax=Leptothrix cholodnii (strain ATCC 51168 / LMG 8142 / SP-6) TaxID=395495 RepID=B1Y7P0_LEPCP|nr:lysophospholipid acyltransferase family protein [Leptothrix cholodnii]ACB32488.1 phospholipid/glycerol acyltransferase [Leptothrix cholodnii SP-6]
MIYLRSFLYLLFLIVTVMPWAIVAVVASIGVRGTPLYWLCTGWLRLAIWGARRICGVQYRVQGLENVPSAANGRAAVILVPKHQSTWETFAFPAIMPHPLAYVFKRELLYIPFFGWAIARLDMVHINRARQSEAWRKVVEQGTQIMAGGTWMIMFPEGTRTPRGSQGAYKTGASRLAVATGTPLVPIAVTSARCWPRKSFLLRPGVIDVSIGKPIEPAGRRPDDLMREVEAWIEGEMRRLDPEAYPPHEAPASP